MLMETKFYSKVHWLLSILMVVWSCCFPLAMYADVNAPTNVTVTNLAPTSATLTWTTTSATDDNLHVYDIRVSTVALSSSQLLAATAETEGMVIFADSVTIADAEYAMTSLTAATHYYASIRENGVREYSGVTAFVTYEFNTPCPATSDPSVSVNFDDLTSIPMCWSTYGQAPVISSAQYNGTSGKSIAFTSQGSYLFSPIFAPNAKAYYFTAFVRGTVGSVYTIGVAAASDMLNVSPLLQGTIATNAWMPIDAAIPADIQSELESGEEYVWVIYTPNSDNAISVYMDDITISGMPACIAPNNLQVADVTTTTAQISWTERGTAAAWQIELQQGEDSQVLDVTANPYVLNALSENTSYAVRVKAVCDDEDASDWTDWISFKTDCGVQPIPFLEDFESVTAIPDCWNQQQTQAGSGSGTNYGDDGWTINTYSSNVHNGSKSLQLRDALDGTHTILVLPHFVSESAGSLTLSFWMYRNANTYSVKYDEGVKVWVNSQPNLNGATALMHVTRCGIVDADELKVAPVTVAGWYQYEKALPVAGDFYVIFEGISEYGAASYLDDIEVVPTPTCQKPSDLTLSSFDAESAILSWTAGGDETNWVLTYKINSEDTVTVEVSGTPQYTIEGLTASTAYTLSGLSVQAVCSESDKSAVVSFSSLSFKTLCLAVDGVNETFEDVYYSYSSYSLPDCWTRVYTSNAYSSYPYVYSSTYGSYAHSGTKYLYMYAYSALTAYVALPEISGDVKDYRLSLYAYASNASSYYPHDLIIGVMENNTDTLTFVPVDTITCGSSYGTDPYIVSFANYTGTGKYVTIKYDKVETTIYVDDVVLEPIPSCEKPSGLTASQTSDQVTLSWTAGGSETKWELTYQLDENEAQTVIVENTPHYSITGLEASTSYTISNIALRAICAEGDTSAVYTMSALTVKTKCAVASLPLIESFDAITSNVPECWDNSDVTANYSSTAWQSNSSGLSGRCVYTYDYSNAANLYALLKTPIFGVENDRAVELTFSYKGNERTLFEVYLSRDGGVTFEQTPLATNLSAEVWTEETIYFDALASEQLVIGFKATGTSAYDYRYVYLDEVSIKAPLCARPSGVSVKSVSASDATISWKNTGVGSYKALLYASAQEEINESEALQVKTSTTAEVTFDGLSANTAYYVYVLTLCDEENSEYSKVFSFRTECAAVAVPFSESFEDEGAVMCYTVVGNAATLSSSTVAFSGDQSLSITTDSVGVMLVLPRFDVTTLAPYEISLAAYSDPAANLPIGVMTDMNDISTFIDLGMISLTAAKSWNEYSLSLSALAGADYEDWASAQYVTISIPAHTSVLLDEISVNVPTACAKPTALGATAVGEDVEFDWVSDAASHNMEIMLGDEVVFSGAVSKPFTPTGLDANTNYKARVQAVCGEDVSQWSVWVDFKTPCALASLPFSEDFSGSTIPDCWTNEHTAGSNTTLWSVESGAAYLNYQSTGNEVALTTPTFAVTAGTTYQVKFDVKHYVGSSYDDKLTISLVEGNSTTLLREISKNDATSSSTATAFECFFTPTEDYAQIEFKAIWTNGYSYSIDNVLIDNAPTCLKPSDLVIDESSITTTSAKLTWTANSDESQWQLTYKLSTKSTTDTVIVSGTPEYTLSDLSAGSSFILSSLSLRAICSETDSSEVASFSNISFATECVTATLPFDQDFNAITSGIPACWDNSEGTASYESYRWRYYSSGYEGGCLRFDSYYNTDGATNVLYTPQINLTEDSRLSFYYKNPTDYYSTGAEIAVLVLHNGQRDTLSQALPAVSAWTPVVFDLSDYTGQTVKILFAATCHSYEDYDYDYGDEYYGDYGYLDNVIVEAIPSCAATMTLVVSEMTSTSAVISIIDEQRASWEYVLSSTENTPVAVTDTFFTISGLSPSTDYTVYVRSLCSETELSPWKKITLHTGCAAVESVEENFESVVSSYSAGYNIPECWTRVYTSSTSSYPYVYDYSSYAHSGTKSLYAYGSSYGTPLDAIIALPEVSGNAADYRIILWAYKLYSYTNGDLVIGVLNSVADTSTFVPVQRLTLTTSYQKFTVALTNYTGSGKYIAIKYDNVQDYIYIDDVVVELIPACEALQSVTVSNVSRREFDINITPKDVNAQHFDLVISETALSDAELAEVTPISLDTTGYHASGLTRETTYYIYARQNCGDEKGAGEWKSIQVKTKGMVACEDVVIGNGSYTTDYAPVYGSWVDAHQKTQTIYPASMLTELVGQSITKLHYYVSSGSSSAWSNAQFTISLGVTALESLSTAYATETLTPVYSGTLSASVDEGMDVEFTTPFVYNGGNLVIQFEETVSAGFSSCTFKADYVSGASRYEYSSYSDNSLQYRPQVAFSYCYATEACPAIDVAGVSHEYVQDDVTSVVLNWGASEGDYANSYDVLVSTAAVEDFTDVVPTFDSLQVLTTTLTGLSEFTDYYVYFRTNCDAEGQNEGSSVWSEAYIFKTKSNCEVVTDVQVVVTGKTTADLSWVSDDNQFMYFLADTILTVEERDAQTAISVVDTTGVALSGLVPGQSYYAYVAQSCGEAHSPFNISNVFTMPAACPAVQNLEATYTAHNAVALQWERGAYADENAWEVGIVGDEASVKNVTEMKAMFIGLQPDSLYTFYVKALCDEESSSLAATIDIRTNHAPADGGATVALSNDSSFQYPIWGAYVDHYEMTQSIYPASILSELVGSTILGLHYTVINGTNAGVWDNLSFTVKMGMTSQTSLSSSWSTDATTQVYNGTVTANPQDGMTITFETPFVYTGGNIVIEFTNDVSVNHWAHVYFKGSNGYPGASRRTYSSTISGLSSGYTYDDGFLPTVMFLCESQSGCRKVSNLKVEAVETESATISYFPGGDETSWYVYNSATEMSEEDLNALDLVPTTDMQVTVNALTPGTTYYFYVAGICSDSVNNWAMVEYETTPLCPAVQNIESTFVAHNMVAIQWERGEQGAENEWEVGIVGDEASVKNVTEMKAMFIGLQPDSLYTFYVKALCDEESSSLTATIDISTNHAPADDGVTVADGTETTFFCPIYGSWLDSYTRAQSIYPEAMLSELVGSTIRGLHYYVTDNPSYSSNANAWDDLPITIKVGITTMNDLAYGWADATTQVYYGTITANHEEGMTIIFDTPFTYTGGNIVIESTNETTDTYQGLYCYAIYASNASRYAHSNYDVMSEAGTTDNKLPKVDFLVESQEGCRKVVNLSLDLLDTDKAEFSWLPGGDETSWYVYNSATALTDAELNALALTPITEMSVEVSDLASFTDYHFYVAGICSDSVNNWSVYDYKTLATCPQVVLGEPQLNTDTAILTWNKPLPSFSGSYQVAVGLASEFDLSNSGSFTLYGIAGESLEVTGLEPLTRYSFAVKALCSEEDESVWSDITTFRTGCFGLLTLPFDEDFNTLTTEGQIPDCWDNSEGTTTNENYRWSFYATGHEGACVRFNSYNNSTGLTNTLYSPSVWVGDVNNVLVRFYYKNPTGGAMNVYLYHEDGTYETLLNSVQYVYNWTEFKQAVSVNANEMVKLAFKGTSNYGSGDAYLYVDDVRISVMAESTPNYDITCSGTAYDGFGFHLNASEVTAGVHTLTFIEEAVSDTQVDTLRTLVLTVGESKVTYITDTACAYSEYNKYGFSIPSVNPNRTTPYMLSGLQTAFGCDSTVSLTIYVPQTEFAVSQVICEGDAYEFGDTTLTTEGTYTRAFVSTLGCDSIVTLTLDVLPAAVTLSETICRGDSVLFDGAYRKATGAYVANLTNMLGCDSVVTLNLTVLETTSYEYEATFCSGSGYTDENFVGLDKDSTYTLVLTNAIGCDSVITLVLTEHHPVDTTINVVINEGEVYVFDNDTKDKTGTWTANLGPDQFGCDSIVTLNLTVLTGLQEVLNDEQFKNAEKFMYNGILYIRANDVIYDARGKRVIVRKEED